jgi:outer membrane lipoprotein-sorting protein
MLPIEESDDTGVLLRQCYSGLEPKDEFVSLLQDRLMNEMADSKPLAARPLPLDRSRPEPAGVWDRIAHYTGGLTMRQRIVLGGIATAVSLALVVFWAGLLPKRLSAMERMAEGIRQAKSYKMTMVFEITFVYERGKPPATSKLTAKSYWLAPNSYRIEEKGDAHWQGKDDTEIFPSGKPGIRIDNKTKSFARQAARGRYLSGLEMLEKLSDFSGQADRKLGTKEIHAKSAWGFEIDAKKIDPDFYPGPVEIWLDAESNLPAFVHWEMRSPVLSSPMIVQMQDFEWNIDLPPKSFEAEPPVGYVQEEVKEQKPESVLEGIVRALKNYSELCGEHYPQVAKGDFAEPVRDEMYKAAGISYPPTAKESREKNYKKILDAEGGFAGFNRVFMSNSDVAYYGKTVGPSDKDKVLLRWKLDDGRYEVIFGDLRAEIVTAEKLRALEGK